MLTRIVRIAGIFIIVLFSIACVFFAIVERDMNLQMVSERARTILTFPSTFESRFYDWRMTKTINTQAFDNRMVLVKIDEPSLEKLGRWPFTRLHWVKFMHKMQAFGAKVTSFDVFFVEPEMACSGETPDDQFAKGIKHYLEAGGKVVLPYSLNPDGLKTDREFSEIPECLYNFVADTKQIAGLNLQQMSVSKDAFPYKTYQGLEVGLAHIEATGDSDGIYRHYQFMSNVEDLYFPSFSLMTYEYFTGDKPRLEILAEGEYHLKFNHGTVKLNRKGESKVRWFGDMRAYPDVSLVDVLNAPDNDPKMLALFKDKIAFIGSTAFGAHDFRHTPIDPQMPGIYFHMNVLSMLLEGKFFKSGSDSTLISWVMLLGGTILMIIAQLFGMPIVDLLVMGALTGGLFYLDTYILLPLGYEIKLFFCLFSIVSCYSWNTFLNFYLSNKDKAFLKSAFGNYISPELIDEMYASGQPPQLGGNEDVITAYFTDIASFSTFSEKLGATKLVELLNEYLTVMTDILLEEKGTLDKYEGDAIIAFFGAPMQLEDHAIRAVRVAVRMQDALLELRRKWESEGDKWPLIVQQMRMRIGVNSGRIVTGNMGSTQRMNYTMMGDSVNLAARLEEAAKQYGIFTHISHFTKDLIGEEFVLRQLDTILVVGKSEPVTTFDVLGMTGKTDQKLIDLKTEFEKGLQLYLSQQWDGAIDQFQKSLVFENLRFPEFVGKKSNPSLIYIERCEKFKQNPPGVDWNGVYTLTEK